MQKIEFHYLILIVSAVLSIGVYAGLYMVLKPQRKLDGIDVESLRGGEEMQRLLDDARNDLNKMKGSTSKIKDNSVQSDAHSLCDTGERIYVYLNEHPEKISLAKRFFTYYLDTAVNILSRYVEIQNTGLNTYEVNEVMKKTSGSLLVVTYSPTYRGGGFSLKYGNPYSINELSPCVPRFLF